MIKKYLLTILSVLLISLLFTSAVFAAVSKYTFNDVVIDEQTLEIEASVKNNKKGAYSNCSYYTDDYAEWLGNYQEDVFAGETEEEVLEFCEDHFENIEQ